MDKEQLNVRISKALADKLDQESATTGRSKTWIVTAAVSDYLDVPHEAKDIETLHERLTALESKFERLQDKPVSKEKESRTEYIPPHERDDFGELITKEEASEMTGYAVGSLSRTLSVKGIHIKSRDGKKGLYSKAEIMDKIGYNDPEQDPRRRTT